MPPVTRGRTPEILAQITLFWYSFGQEKKRRRLLMSITGISRFVIAILVVCHIATAYSAVYCDWIGSDG